MVKKKGRKTHAKNFKEKKKSNHNKVKAVAQICAAALVFVPKNRLKV